MKATLIFSLLLSVSIYTPLWANSTTVANKQFCVHNQLTSQNWESTSGTVWQFNPDGSLLQLAAAEQRVSVGRWSLQAAKGSSILQIDLENGQVYWSWENDCSAASLRLATTQDETLDIHAMPTKPVAKALLTGDWQEGVHANHPVFSFSADGTYQRLCRAAGDLALTTGHWMISNDGNTLLLYRPEGQLEAFALKYLNMDEMVLQAYRPGAKDCFLNKL